MRFFSEVEASFIINICLSQLPNRPENRVGAKVLIRAYEHLYGKGSFLQSRRRLDGQIYLREVYL